MRGLGEFLLRPLCWVGAGPTQRDAGRQRSTDLSKNLNPYRRSGNLRQIIALGIRGSNLVILSQELA